MNNRKGVFRPGSGLPGKGFSSVLLFVLLSSWACQPRTAAVWRGAEAMPPAVDCLQWRQSLDSLAGLYASRQALVVSTYDNSAYPYLQLQPGQYALKQDTLLFRPFEEPAVHFFRQAARLRVRLLALPEAGERAAGQQEVLASLWLDSSLYARSRIPYFAYKFPLNGRQVAGQALALQLALYGKGNQADSSLCEPVAGLPRHLPLACCTGREWQEASLRMAIPHATPPIAPKTYRYAGFSGLVDIRFDPNSSLIRDSTAMLSRIQQQIDRFAGMHYQIESVHIIGYASIEGGVAQNLELSTRRAGALYRGLKARYPALALDYEGRGEDWGLSSRLIRQHVPPERAAAVAELLAAALHPDSVEQALRRLVPAEAFWQAILPPARHTLAVLRFSYQGPEEVLQFFPDSLPLESEALAQAAAWQLTVAPYSRGQDVQRQSEALTALIQSEPKAEWYALRAGYQYAAGHYAAALADMQAAEAEDAPRWRRFRWLLLANMMEQLSPADRSRLLQEVAAVQEPAPDTAWARLLQALLLEAEGQTGTAISLLQSLAAHPTLQAEALNNLGVCYLKSYQLQAARQAFRAALNHRPTLAEAYFNQAVLAAYLGLTAEAAARLDDALALKPEWKREISSNPVFREMRTHALFDHFEWE